jgi:hypothetical protein
MDASTAPTNAETATPVPIPLPPAGADIAEANIDTVKPAPATLLATCSKSYETP